MRTCRYCIVCLVVVLASSLRGIDAKTFLRSDQVRQPYLLVADKPRQVPVIDGDLSDPCWQNAAHVGGFVSIANQQAAGKRTIVWALFDSKYLYLAFAAEDDDVLGGVYERDDKQTWKNDCFEFFISPQMKAETERHFILGAGGSVWDGCPAFGGASWNPEWLGEVKKHDWGYSGEMRIPISAFIDTTAYDASQGARYAVKFTRMNRSGKGKENSSWTPLEASTLDQTNSGLLQFGSSSLLGNADFSKTKDNGLPLGWSYSCRSFDSAVTNVPQPTFKVVKDPTSAANNTLDISFKLKNEYIKFYIGTDRMLSIPRLPYQQSYRFSADIRWKTKDKLTDRPRPTLYFPNGHGDNIKIQPGDEWRKYQVDYLMPAGKNRLQIVLMGARIEGVLSLKNLLFKAVENADHFDKNRLGSANLSGAFKLIPGKPLSLEKIDVVDCRTMTVFIHNPVDGRLDSRGHSNNRMEYPFMSGEYGKFDYTDKQVLHVTLADKKGVDAFLLRGNFDGKLYHDGTRVDGPGDNAVFVSDVKSRSYVFRKQFKKRIASNRFDFCPENNAGKIADLAFFRVNAKQEGSDNDVVSYAINSVLTEIPGKIKLWMDSRFSGDSTVLTSGTGGAAPVKLRSEDFLQIITPKQPADKGISAVDVSFKISQLSERGLLTIRVQDPLNPRRELMGADFVADRKGHYKVTMDFPDQVLIPEKQIQSGQRVYPGLIAPPPVIWLTLASGVEIQLEDIKIDVCRVPGKEALKPALAQRKFLLKGYFIAMSGPRPWTRIKPNTDIIKFIKTVSSGEYFPGLEQLFETVEQCHYLAPDDPVVNQYYQWMFEDKLPKSEKTVKLPEIRGAPRWAILAHQAYLASSAVPRWWVNHRLLLSGEMGGSAQDDSDLYQTWATFPLIEDKPLGEKIKQGALALNELVVRKNLKRGLNIRRTDVLHAYEEGINHLALSSFWFYGDPVLFERVMESADSVMKLTVTGKDGHRYFSGHKTCAADLENKGKQKVESEIDYHSLLMHPIYEVVFYNRNPKALAFFRDYVEHRISLQKPGKWCNQFNIDNTGKVGGFTNRPGAYYHGETWLAMYQMTGDAKYLAPYKEGIENGVWWYRKNWQRWPRILAEEELRSMARTAFPDRPQVMDGYNGFLITGDKTKLEHDLEQSLDFYRRFPHMLTTAEPQTDRVLLFNYAPVPYCYLGTFANRNAWSHDPVVSYEGFGSAFAALVYPTPRDRVKVALFNFSEKPLAGHIRVWRLPNGVYRVNVGPDQNDDGVLDSTNRETSMVLHKYVPIEVTLPVKQLTLVDITPKEPLDTIYSRPDLAVSPLDTKRDKAGVLSVNVHNIGSAKAANIEIALVRNGKSIEKQVISELNAPLDLKPKMKTVTFRNCRPNDEIMIDPDNKLKEITKHNNVLIID